MTRSFKRLWQRLLFQDRGILPTRRLIGLFFVNAFVIFLASFSDVGWRAFFILNSLLILASLLDLFFTPGKKLLSCARVIKEEYERGEDFSVQLRLANHSKTNIFFRLIDDLPRSFANPFPVQGEVAGQETIPLIYRTKTDFRGDFELEKIYLRYRSTLGLWEKQTFFKTSNKLKIIPDLSQMRGYLATAQRFLIREGNKIKRNRLGGGEFAQVRKYVIGDDPRKINWRQTAKLAEVMTNVYEPEHGKHITILIDSGRTMGVELTRANRLELALEAAITVSAAALKQGDYVSVLAFSSTVRKYIPPGKGFGHLKTIISGIYNLQSDSKEANYLEAFHYLEKVQKRRSFVLLFSELDSFLFEESQLYFIQRLRRRHIFLLMGIADPMVDKWTKVEPEDTRIAMIKSTAQKSVLQRKEARAKWRNSGVDMVEVPEEKLAIEAVTHYIDVINQGIV